MKMKLATWMVVIKQIKRLMVSLMMISKSTSWKIKILRMNLMMGISETRMMALVYQVLHAQGPKRRRNLMQPASKRPKKKVPMTSQLPLRTKETRMSSSTTSQRMRTRYEFC